MTEVNFRDIPPRAIRKTNLPANRGTASRRASFPGRVSPLAMRRPAYWSAVEEMHADLFRADYWRALQNRIVKGMWKMFMRIGAGKDLAYVWGDAFLSKASI